MNSYRNLWIAMVVVLIIAIGAYFYPRVSNLLGLASGPSHSQAESFLQGLAGGQRDQFRVTNTGMLSQGGSVFSTTSSGTVTLTAASVVANGTFVYTPIIATGGVVKLPTKEQLATASNNTFIPNAGDRTTRYFYNSTTSAVSLTTLAGNTGVILQVASTTNVAGGGVTTISGHGTAILHFWRSATSTDIYVQALMFK
jgi:hypothetical protein